MKSRASPSPAGRPQLRGAARVLVIAEAPVAQIVALALNHGVYDVRMTSDTIEADALKRDWKPHLLVIDVALADGDGLRIVQERFGVQRIPSIVLTERGDLKTKLAAFEHGADDFITVPVNPEEFVARTLALMRRTYGEAVPFTPVIRVGDLRIDLLNQTVTAGTSTLRLTSIEQALLYLLASNPERTVTREEILDALWGSDYVAESNLVDRHIRNLRVKLKNSWRHPRFIATVPGKGYRFLVASERIAAS